MTSYLIRGVHFWGIEQTLDDSRIYPVIFGRYFAEFMVQKKEINNNLIHVTIKMKLNYEKNQMLLKNDKRNANLVFKLNNDKTWANNSYKVNKMDEYIVLFDKDISKKDRVNNNEFIMQWNLGKIKGFNHQQIQFEKDVREKKEELLKYILLNGDIKIYYECNVEHPIKKRKLNNNKCVSIGGDDEKNNFLRMSSLLLRNESLFYKTYLSQKHFEDSGYVNFSGNKNDLLHFIEFIVCDRINKRMNALKMIKTAGIYGVRRLQTALIRNIVDAMIDDKYVDTMNTLIRNDMVDDVFSELIDYGVMHYKRLKRRGDWNQLNKSIVNTVKLLATATKNRK